MTNHVNQYDKFLSFLWTILASYDMVAPSCNGIMAMGLLFLLVDSMIKEFYFMKRALDLMVKFVTAHYSLSGSPVTTLLVSVGHPRSDLVGLLV